MAVTVAAFYRFVAIDDCSALRDWLLSRAAGLKGTIILAPEGINGTIAGENVASFLQALQARFEGLQLKLATTAKIPFRRLKIRLKREIVTLGVAVDPRARVGTYVDPIDWNALLDDPDVTLVDARNAFEVAQGTFPGAIDPGTQSFGAFPAFAARTLDPAVHRKVAMFCTGGIRCEKASALLLAQGFSEVLHLKGGILDYLAQVPALESRWQGRCFVFDEREAVGGITEPSNNGL